MTWYKYSIGFGFRWKRRKFITSTRKSGVCGQWAGSGYVGVNLLHPRRYSTVELSARFSVSAGITLQLIDDLRTCRFIPNAMGNQRGGDRPQFPGKRVLLEAEEIHCGRTDRNFLSTSFCSRDSPSPCSTHHCFAALGDSASTTHTYSNTTRSIIL